MIEPKKTTEEQRIHRKFYVKPQIEQVRLVLEEAVLGTGCKSATSAGPSDPCEINFTTCLINGS